MHNFSVTENEELILRIYSKDNITPKTRNLFKFYIFAPIIGIIVCIVLAFMNDISLLLACIPLAFVSLYFYSLYNWNRRGKEIITFSNTHLKKINDYGFYQSTAYDANFENLDLYIIINGEWITGEFIDTIHSPQASDYEERVNLRFVLHKANKQLVIPCSIKLTYADAEHAMRMIKAFLES